MLGLDDLVDTETFVGTAAMRCPNCGHSAGLHIRKLECDAGGNVTMVDHSGTIQRQKKPKLRGTSIRIHYVCERCNEKTSLYQRFNKGVVTVETESHGTIPTSDKYTSWDIWRD